MLSALGIAAVCNKITSASWLLDPLIHDLSMHQFSMILLVEADFRAQIERCLIFTVAWLFWMGWFCTGCNMLKEGSTYGTASNASVWNQSRHCSGRAIWVFKRTIVSCLSVIVFWIRVLWASCSWVTWKAPGQISPIWSVTCSATGQVFPFFKLQVLCWWLWHHLLKFEPSSVEASHEFTFQSFRSLWTPVHQDRDSRMISRWRERLQIIEWVMCWLIMVLSIGWTSMFLLFSWISIKLTFLLFFLLATAFPAKEYLD